MPAKKKSAPEKKALPKVAEVTNIEEDIHALEEILTSMEEDELPLNALINKYEEGSKLLENCLSSIKVAKERVELVQVNLDKALDSDHTSHAQNTEDDSSSHDGQLL